MVSQILGLIFKMNKRGFAVFFSLMIGVLFFILGLALAPSISKAAGESMSTSELNCSNDSISQQDKAVCTQIDLMTFLYTGFIFGLAGFVLASIVT